jgi:hypothetical protein
MINSAKISGQNNCNTSVPLDSFNVVKKYYMTSNEYWLHFNTDSLYFSIFLKQCSDSNSTEITTINFYKGECNNLTLIRSINLYEGDSSLTESTQSGENYYIQLISNSNTNGYFKIYSSNITKSPINLICGNPCTNPNPHFNDLSADLIAELNGTQQNQLYIDPMQTGNYSDVCNWRQYTGSPQIFKEANGNYYLYMWAQSYGGNPGQECAYNLLTGNTVVGGLSLVVGNNYNVSLRYRVHYIQINSTITQGIDGLSIKLYNYQTYQSVTIHNVNLTNSALNQWITLNFVFTCTNANFNAIMLEPYCNSNTLSNSFGGIDIDDVVINEILNINKPIISGNPNNCNETTGYSISNPQSCVSYQWTIQPQSAGSVVSGQGTQNITVKWDDVYKCNATLNVTATMPGSSSMSSSINIYPCCETFITKLNNATIGNATYNQLQININGDLHVTGHLIFDNCFVNISPYSKIIIEPNAKLELRNGTQLTKNRCCDIMWDGIYLNDNTSTLIATSSTLGITVIEYSINGIVASNNANLNIIGVNFNNNATSMKLKNYLPQQTTFNIKLNKFNGGQMVKPYLGERSWYGIKAENVDNVIIGDFSSNIGNRFQNLYCGIYSLNSYIRVYGNHFIDIVDNPNNPYQCQSLTNPLLVCKPTAIHSAHSLTNNPSFINAPKKVEIGYINTFDNCVNGIKVYNEKAIISSNIVRASLNAIDVLDPLNYSVINNNIVENCSNGTSPYKGIQVLKTQPGFINLSINNNSVKTRGMGIYVGNCKSQRLSQYRTFFVDINENTVKVAHPNNATKGIVVQNCPAAYVKCNTIDRLTAFLPSEPMANILHGISVEQTQNAEIQQNHVKYMGAGINVYGCSDLTQFYCNTLESDFYGFLFNQHASITNQGTEKIRTDNKWTPYGNYSGYYLGQQVEHKLWALNHNLNPNGINWYYDNTASVIYNPENATPTNPTLYKIIPSSTLPNSTNLCNLSCPPSSIKEMTLEEREEKFGAIVRDELEYPDLNEQFREYNRYILYQTLKENPWIMTMGGADDYMYQDFFNNENNGNIGKFDALETLIAEGNIDQALVKNGQIIDSTLIAYNQRVVNHIYLITFARDSYELTPGQYQTLYDIATNYTPWEGGEGVYIARYMLGIDIDYSNPNVQFSKGDGGIAEAEMLSVFPNPASNNITLSFANAIEGGFVVDVYNHTGAKVLTETLSQTQAQYQLNTAKLKNGIYFISVRTNNQIFKTKFTIIK